MITNNFYSTILSLFVLIGSFLVCDSVFADETVVLKTFGRQVIERAPDHIKNSSDLDKARYLFAAYTNALANKGINVNDRYLLRVWNLVAHGDGSRWSCADHAGKLESVFEGAGLSRVRSVYITADSEWKIPPPNNEHGALAFIYEGHYYVFDAWMHAYERGGGATGFEDGSTSKYNGIPLGRWQHEMMQKGYIRFSGNDGTSYEPTAIKAIQGGLDGFKQHEDKKSKNDKETATPTTNKGGNVWEFKKYTTSDPYLSENACYPGKAIILGESMAKFTQNYVPCGGAVEKPGKAESLITWAFPKTLTPNSMFWVDFKITRSSDPIPLYGEAMVVWYFGGQNNIPGTLELKGRLDNPELKKEETKRMYSPVVPEGKPGDKLTMWVNVSGESGMGDVFYEYEMVSDSN
jgi:hypothetical protein